MSGDVIGRRVERYSRSCSSVQEMYANDKVIWWMWEIEKGREWRVWQVRR